METIYGFSIYVRFKLLTYYRSIILGRNHWGSRAAMPPPSPKLQFLTQKRSSSLIFKYQRYCFLWVLRNYMNQTFHDFHRVCYNFWIIYISFFLTTLGK